MLPFKLIYIPGNKTNRKMATSVRLLQMDIGKVNLLNLFASNVNKKQKFVFLGQQTINGNQQ
jgi:hypothetical protein